MLSLLPKKKFFSLLRGKKETISQHMKEIKKTRNSGCLQFSVTGLSNSQRAGPYSYYPVVNSVPGSQYELNTQKHFQLSQRQTFFPLGFHNRLLFQHLLEYCNHIKFPHHTGPLKTNMLLTLIHLILKTTFLDISFFRN